MKKSNCDSFAIEELLSDDCNAQVQTEFEMHLENCERCQARLSGLAADEELWTQAAAHLSTIETVRLPEPIVNQLSQSGTLVIPKFDQWSANTGFSKTGLAHQPASTSREVFGANGWVRILDPPSHPEMLGRIDEFEVESKIGQGGMGIVLKGFDRELNRAVAIKILSPQLAANGTARQRFAREAEAAAAVMHPNVVPIYSVNKSPDRPYIVMQLVPGHSLQTLVQDNGPLNPTEVVRVSMQIAAGLSAAHKLGIIHRDVKPSNMLVERDVSRVMITDFGLARAVDDAGMTQTGWLAGTPHYMSPEQARGDELDTRNDLFSLGSLMYFIATGREPFRGQRPYAVIQKIINEDQANPMSIHPKVPKPLCEIIEKLLEKDPKNRFQTAGDVFGVLEKYHAHLQHPTQIKPPKRILTLRRKRQRAWWIGVPLAICGCMLALAGLNWSGIFEPSKNRNGSSATAIEKSSGAPDSKLSQRLVDPKPAQEQPLLIEDSSAFAQPNKNVNTRPASPPAN